MCRALVRIGLVKIGIPRAKAAQRAAKLTATICKGSRALLIKCFDRSETSSHLGLDSLAELATLLDLSLVDDILWPLLRSGLLKVGVFEENIRVAELLLE